MSDFPPTLRARAQTWIRDSLVTGIIASVPMVTVWWVFNRIVLNMDGVLALVPQSLRNTTWTAPFSAAPIPFLKTPGLGFILSIVILVLIVTIQLVTRSFSPPSLLANLQTKSKWN